jgi:hypothetical protein
MSAKQFRTWDEYAEEAKIEPFRLKVSDDETLVFEAPSSAALPAILRAVAEGDIETLMANLAGEEQWPRLLELFGSVTHKAMPSLAEDLLDHFDLYEPVTLVGPGGGKVTRKRPREIMALINQGYRPLGEAPASRP